MRLLFYEWNSLTHPYIYKAMKEQGIHLDIARMPYKPRNPKDQEQFKETLAKMLDMRSYDAVFSINFFDQIAEVCHDKDIMYVSWSYDSPSLGGTRRLIIMTRIVFFYSTRQKWNITRE